MDEEIIHCIKISGEEAHLVILFRLMKSERRQPAARGSVVRDLLSWLNKATEPLFRSSGHAARSLRAIFRGGSSGTGALHRWTRLLKY